MYQLNLYTLQHGPWSLIGGLFGPGASIRKCAPDGFLPYMSIWAPSATIIASSLRQKPWQTWRTCAGSCADQDCARLMYLSRDIGQSFGTNSRHIWPLLLVGLALFWPPLLVGLAPPLCRTPDHQRTIGEPRADRTPRPGRRNTGDLFWHLIRH